MKKSLLFLITSIMCLSTGYMTAYTHLYVNKTDDNIILWLGYVACQGARITIKKGETYNLDAKGCCIKRVEGCLAGNCQAKLIWTGSDSSYGMHCGNATWHILSDNRCCFFTGVPGSNSLGTVFVNGNKVGGNCTP